MKFGAEEEKAKDRFVEEKKKRKRDRVNEERREKFGKVVLPVLIGRCTVALARPALPSTAILNVAVGGSTIVSSSATISLSLCLSLSLFYILPPGFSGLSYR